MQSGRQQSGLLRKFGFKILMILTLKLRLDSPTTVGFKAQRKALVNFIYFKYQSFAIFMSAYQLLSKSASQIKLRNVLKCAQSC